MENKLSLEEIAELLTRSAWCLLRRPSYTEVTLDDFEAVYTLTHKAKHFRIMAEVQKRGN